ncbi:hypothetical protein GCM10011415_19740 [Salipiger pallidus]|uniref:Uncharacterized protein n=1 Tax=Salipiger pallidus TaxID=1775170 RepID=A0A8J2ZJW1_9RHOB|nr:hypothetical protein [Salipiger pallidus]GGG71844.1 hypothetical protein GCM10011415_19740 [Salipiger pallidus]
MSRYSLGDLSFTLDGGALRYLRLGETEIIRQVAFLVRDRDWGTIPAEVGEVQETGGEGIGLLIPLTFRTDGATLSVTVALSLTGSALTLRATGTADAPFETNRAGFTLLHPIEGVAGAPATVTHPDGQTQDKPFPTLIDPWRPFEDIVRLDYVANGLAISCALSGDTFEMEDQRQWGDASFKTYNRSLDLPWPYALPQGTYPPQEVTLGWSHAEAPAVPSPRPRVVAPTFPETALLVTPEEATVLAQDPSPLALVSPQRLLCHVDATHGAVADQFAAFAALQHAVPDMIYDLELIGSFDGPPGPELHAHANAMTGAGFTPASVFTCPSVDRQSTPPGSDWPACPPLAEIHAAAAQAFPNVTRGGGMASLFTELNRKRPPTKGLDFITHGLCPIVHAADDHAVMETLQAVPHITASALAIADGREYRIGPATIAMRQNPYGSRTIPNPKGSTVCMTDDDPRHRGTFGAAYVLGLATALASAGIAVWTPTCVLGPRGITGLDGPYPLAEVLKVLSGLAGHPVEQADIRDGIATLTVAGRRLRANLEPVEQNGLAPYSVDVGEV